MRCKQLSVLALTGIFLLTACGQSSIETEKSPTATAPITEAEPEIVNEAVETEEELLESSDENIQVSPSDEAGIQIIRTIQDLYDSFGMKFGMSSFAVEAAWGEPLIDAQGKTYYPFDSIAIFEDIPINNQFLYINYNEDNMITGFSVECTFDGEGNNAKKFEQQAEVLCGVEPKLQAGENQPYLHNVYDIDSWDVTVAIVSLGEEQTDLNQGPMIGSISLTEKAS